ncbi:hypothetical protein Dimus_037031, partial [Dionaea muscipula]
RVPATRRREGSDTLRRRLLLARGVREASPQLACSRGEMTTRHAWQLGCRMSEERRPSLAGLVLVAVLGDRLLACITLIMLAARRHHACLVAAARGGGVLGGACGGEGRCSAGRLRRRSSVLGGARGGEAGAR